MSVDSLWQARGRVRHRVVVSYAVAPGRLAPHLPETLRPAIRDESAYLSVVGSTLAGLRVGGLPVPGTRGVPVVELRTPVRHPATGRKGTFTFQAHAAGRLVAWGARIGLGLSVQAASMQPMWRERSDAVTGTYRFDWKGREQRVRVEGHPPPVMPAPNTVGPFLLERPWRVGQRGDALVWTCAERPAAPLYRVDAHHVTVQWRAVYGEVGALLTDRRPAHVLMAPGRPVALERQ
jgi:uncharacterized protein YqjF (DUF2071 family)